MASLPQYPAQLPSNGMALFATNRADGDGQNIISVSRSVATSSKRFQSHIHMMAGSARVMVQVEPIDIDRRDDAVDDERQP